MNAIDFSKLPKFPAHRLTYKNGAQNNLVYLIEYKRDVGLVVKQGWKAVGYAEAPCFKMDSLAVAFERTDEPVPEFEDGHDFDEGTIIWHHVGEDEFPEDHEARSLACK